MNTKLYEIPIYYRVTLRTSDDFRNVYYGSGKASAFKYAQERALEYESDKETVVAVHWTVEKRDITCTVDKNGNWEKIK